jgi:hypothetical protein
MSPFKNLMCCWFEPLAVVSDVRPGHDLSVDQRFGAGRIFPWCPKFAAMQISTYTNRHWIEAEASCFPQLWPFTSYNWLFLWDYTFYKWGYKYL